MVMRQDGRVSAGARRKTRPRSLLQAPAIDGNAVTGGVTDSIRRAGERPSREAPVPPLPPPQKWISRRKFILTERLPGYRKKYFIVCVGAVSFLRPHRFP